jgi:REP element-mobilizing transposase RayT
LHTKQQTNIIENCRAGACPRQGFIDENRENVQEQLLDISNRYPSISIDKYIIMPTHIHAIIVIENNTTVPAGASPRPTLMDAVRVFKSISTRLCNKIDNIQGRKIWQTSFHDEVIRNRQVYRQIWQYIDENPIKWHEERE